MDGADSCSNALDVINQISFDSEAEKMAENEIDDIMLTIDEKTKKNMKNKYLCIITGYNSHLFWFFNALLNRILSLNVLQQSKIFLLSMHDG